MRRAASLACVCALAFATSACSLPHPTVFAASSLTEAFEPNWEGVRFNFAGSDELARQIREGASFDVFASANPAHAEALFNEGLIKKPRPFASNSVALIVPAANPAGIDSIEDLRRPGVNLVVAAEGVPIGDYARSVLRHLRLSAALDNVVSEEQDVKGVLGKVAFAYADAGFVYATDIASSVRTIPIPPAAQPHVVYTIALATHPEHPERANVFIDWVLGPKGRAALRAEGFGIP